MSKIIQGDALEQLRTLADGCVQTCVTSPPYYGLRDYGTAKWIGGDPACDHKPGNQRRVGKTTLGGGTATAGHQQEGYRKVCSKCGATREDEQIGLEETPEKYIERLVSVFREVRRVVKDDGTLWVNIGDSYAGSGKGNNPNGKQWTNIGTRFDSPTSGYVPTGCKPKDLIGIPWMLAFALRADGWYLRNEIIWHKPNPMPESVTDRCTKAHEQIFLLAKSAKYFYDNEAIFEPAAYDGKDTRFKGSVKCGMTVPNGKPQTFITEGHERWPNKIRGFTTKEQIDNPQHHGGNINSNIKDGVPARNKRTVWTVNTKPYKGAHFATFPPDLILPCILAGSRPSDTVLDPFNGAGTTGLVAIQNNRDYIGIELNPAYVEIDTQANGRCSTVGAVVKENA